MRKLMTGIAATLLVLGSAACAGVDNPEISRVDNMDRTAFYERFGDGGVFDTWDTDGDGVLDENDFAESRFDAWDLDNDGMLEVGEWDRATESWGIAGFGRMADWDADRDQFVDVDEWERGMVERELFDRFDANRDNRVTGDEFARVAFDIFDSNNDSIVDDTEWDTRYDAWV